MAKKEVKNRLYIRIYNEEQLNIMDGLIASGKFGSKSEIVGKCVDIALPLLLNGKADISTNNNSKAADLSADLLKKQSATLRDLAVVCNLSFNLLQSIFTERALTLSGKSTNADDLNTGVYEKLPEHYQNILAELLR